jgi:hypothetical protein
MQCRPEEQCWGEDQAVLEWEPAMDVPTMRWVTIAMEPVAAAELDEHA